jgi:hypothetical protein
MASGALRYPTLPEDLQIPYKFTKRDYDEGFLVLVFDCGLITIQLLKSLKHWLADGTLTPLLFRRLYTVQDIHSTKILLAVSVLLPDKRQVLYIVRDCLSGLNQ